jgi:hypothetical protein
MAPGVKPLLTTAAVAMTLFAVATVGTRTTLSLLSSNSPVQNSGLAAGTVTLASDASSACTVPSMLPGSSALPCSLTARYSGITPAYLALDVLVETQAGNGGNTLYAPSDPTHDLQVAISSLAPSVSYTVPTTPTVCPGSAPFGSTCYELDDEMISLAPFNSTSDPVTIQTTVSLPANMTPGYRGGQAQILLTAHATQSSNNNAAGCAAGVTCSTVLWS